MSLPPKHRDPLGGFKLMGPNRSASASVGLKLSTTRQQRTNSVGGKTLSADGVRRKMANPPEIEVGRLAACGGITPRYSKDMFSRLKKEQCEKKMVHSAPRPPPIAALPRSASSSPVHGDVYSVDAVAFDLKDSSAPKKTIVMTQAGPLKAGETNPETASTIPASSPVKSGSARALKLAIQKISNGKQSKDVNGPTNSARLATARSASISARSQASRADSSLRASATKLKPLTRSASVQSSLNGVNAHNSVSTARTVRSVVAGKRPVSAHAGATIPPQDAAKNPELAQVVLKASVRTSSAAPKPRVSTRGRVPLRVGQTPATKESEQALTGQAGGTRALAGGSPARKEAMRKSVDGRKPFLSKALAPAKRSVSANTTQSPAARSRSEKKV